MLIKYVALLKRFSEVIYYVLLSQTYTENIYEKYIERTTN